MSVRLLVTLTVVEIVALVVVLAIYVTLIVKGLKSISATLGKVAFGVRAVEEQVSNIKRFTTQANGTLRDITRALPGIAEKAETVAAQGGR